MTTVNKNIAVFLDRDGTIIEDVDYLDHPDRLELIPGSAEAIRLFNYTGFKVVVVTNQSGVARGYFSEEMVKEVHDRLDELLDAHGARLDAIYYCPHHPTSGEKPYRRECECRKPGTGMVDSAARDLNIDVSRSYVVGDKMIDMEIARRVGARGILVRTGYGPAELGRLKKDDSEIRPDYVADDLYAAAVWISEREREM